MKKAVIFEGARIRYSIKGSGPCVFLLHGFGMDSRIWKEVLPAFGGCTVIRMDLPGFGKSEVLESYDLEQLARLVYRVLSAERIEKCLLFGHSMGGYIALAFADRWPEKLMGFGLVHSHCYADTPETLEKRRKTANFVMQHGVEEYVRRFIPELYGTRYKKAHAKQLKKMISRGLSYSNKAYAAGHLAMSNRPDRSHVLISLKVPVLFLIGKEDDTLPLEKAIEQTALPEQSQVELLNKSGHMGMHEQPKKTRAVFRQFLNFCEMSLAERSES